MREMILDLHKMTHMPNESFVKYIQASPLDREWGIYLSVAGYAQLPPSLVYPPRVHPSGYYFTWEKGRILQEYQINYITEGSGVFETVSEQFQVVPGSMLILRPGMWHRYKPDPNTGWNEHYIGFNGVFCSALLNEGFFQSGKPVLYVGFQESLLKLFFEIIRLLGEFGRGARVAAEGMLAAGLVHVVASDAHDLKKRPPRMAAARKRVRAAMGAGVEELLFDTNPAALVANREPAWPAPR